MLPVVTRRSLEPNVDAVELPERPRVRDPVGAGFIYYALTPELCQCRAVEASSLGNLLASEGPAQRAASKGRCLPGDSGRMLVLAASSDEARNLSAAKAMAIYYALAEGEIRLDLTERGLAEFDELLAKTDRMKAQGLELPSDVGEFQRQRNKLEGQRLELELAVARGNHELFRALDIETHDPRARIWPDTALRVETEPLDADAEIAFGLATRPEIRVLRHLPRLPPSESVAATKMLLGGLSPMLGSTPGAAPLGLLKLLFPVKAMLAEAPVRRQQLAELRQRRELELADEIRQAVEALETRVRAVSLAKELVESCRQHVTNTEQKQPISKATFVDVALARLKLLEAQGDLVRSVVAWETAKVQLKQLQGRLLEECPGACFNGGPGVEMSIEPVETPQRDVRIQELLPPVDDDLSDGTPGENPDEDDFEGDQASAVTTAATGSGLEASEK